MLIGASQTSGTMRLIDYFVILKKYLKKYYRKILQTCIKITSC